MAPSRAHRAPRGPKGPQPSAGARRMGASPRSSSIENSKFSLKFKAFHIINFQKKSEKSISPENGFAWIFYMFDMKVFKSSPEKNNKNPSQVFFNEYLSSAAYIFLCSKNWKSWKKCQLGATLPPSHVKHKKNMWKRKVVLVPLGYILTGPGVKNWFWELSKNGQCPPAETLWSASIIMSIFFSAIWVKKIKI